MTTETSNARGEVVMWAVVGNKGGAVLNVFHGTPEKMAEDSAYWPQHGFYVRQLGFTASPPAAARGDVRDAIEVLRRMLANDDAGWAALCVVIQALAAEGVQAGEVEQRARELLAQHEQQDKTGGAPVVRRDDAIRAIASALSQQPEARGVVRHDLCDCPNGRAEHSPSCAALTGERNG